jgi:hypothetical protein|tara:strand:- start:500 stop:928 length:429 start_codon:yes stop_codon:yes gene_type:complete
MIRVRASLEALMGANLLTENLMGGNVGQVLLGDLNASGGTGAFAGLMGPQPGVITLKEVLTGMNTTHAVTSGSLYGGGTTSIVAGSPLQQVAQNFQSNLGNIVVGGIMQTAGWRIFNKISAKSVRRVNGMIRRAGLGSTIQI